jgi:hypothetical protein
MGGSDTMTDCQEGVNVRRSGQTTEGVGDVRAEALDFTVPVGLSPWIDRAQAAPHHTRGSLTVAACRHVPRDVSIDVQVVRLFADGPAMSMPKLIHRARPSRAAG